MLSDFSNFFKFEPRQKISNLNIHKHSLGLNKLEKNGADLGSAVSTFIGYKQKEQKSNYKCMLPDTVLLC